MTGRYTGGTGGNGSGLSTPDGHWLGLNIRGRYSFLGTL